MKDKRLAIIFLTVFIDLMGFGIIIPLNPFLAKHFGASPLMVGLLMAAYSFFQFLFSPIWGQLSDRYGRRPIILVSLLGSAVAHLGFGLSSSLTGLMVARSFAGLFGGNISTAMAYIADITKAEDRSRSMGLIGAAFGMGFLLGPFIGGITADLGTALGAPSPLAESFPALIASAICLLNFLFALRYLPESRVGQMQAQAARQSARLARIREAFATPVLGTVIALVFINTFAMAHVEASLFLFVQHKFDWSVKTASFGFAYIGLILVFTQGYLVRKWLPRIGERASLVIGLSLSAIAFALIGASNELWLLTISVTLLGIGHGLVNPSLHGSVSLLSGENVQGNNLGVSQSLSSIARIVGPPTGGALYQHVGYWSPFIAAGVVAGLGVAIVLINYARLPEAAKKGVH